MFLWKKISKNSKSHNEPYNPGWNDEQIAIIRDVLSGMYLNLVSGGKEAITKWRSQFFKNVCIHRLQCKAT